MQTLRGRMWINLVHSVKLFSLFFYLIHNISDSTCITEVHISKTKSVGYISEKISGVLVSFGNLIKLYIIKKKIVFYDTMF